ncbi:tagatose 1,6-diphosphate aldolase [Aggregatilineales bacterium SYSU G02658]
MTYTLTPGRWRGLQNTSTFRHVFTILAFDQRGSYAEMLPAGTDYAAAAAIKGEVVEALSPFVSAVLLDPDYGLTASQRMASGCGLLLSVEKSGYSGDSTYRKTEFDPAWNVAKIKRVGAQAVKLMVYYHPHSGALAEELEQMTAGLIAECHRYDLPIYLEPMSYSLDKAVKKESAEFAATRQQVVVETARRLSALQPDVLKLEFPLEVKHDHDRDRWRAACAAVSEVASVPWVLLSAGVDFETFAEQTLIACQQGASGYLAGRAIWKECVVMPPAERAAFLTTTARERVERLNAIAAQHARPWTDFYHPVTLEKGWYAQYDA